MILYCRVHEINQKPNSWTYNFVEVSVHNLESSQTSRRGDCEFQEEKLLRLLSQLRPRIRPLSTVTTTTTEGESVEHWPNTTPCHAKRRRGVKGRWFVLWWEGRTACHGVLYGLSSQGAAKLRASDNPSCCWCCILLNVHKTLSWLKARKESRGCHSINSMTAPWSPHTQLTSLPNIPHYSMAL